MATIYRYQKYITREVTRSLEAPEESTELCTLDGRTYVSIPEGMEPNAEQPVEIAHTIEQVVLTPDLRAEISDASPHVDLIRARVRDRIAERYPIHEEIKLIRTAPSPEFDAYNAYAEACRAWGREQKAILGL